MPPTPSGRAYRLYTPHRLLMLAVLGYGACLACVSHAAELTLSTFTNQGMDWAWSEFQQSVQPTHTRLFDNADGWGGATRSFTTPLDWTAWQDAYFKVTYRPEAGHGTDVFGLEVYDTANRSIKFTFDTPASRIGEWITATSPLALHQARDGVGDYANFDFSRISRWNILGHWQSPRPFNVSFDDIRLTTTAPEPYAGAAPDAPWRAQAQQKIDQHRKGDLRVRITDRGQARQGVDVRIRQTGHAYGFGSAVAAGLLVGPDANPAYQQKVTELFNMAVLENDLKWPPLVGDWGPQWTLDRAVAGLDWLKGQGLDARGHTLVWPGWENLPASLRSLENDPTALRQAVLDHVTQIATATAGKVAHWDVINETRTNHDLMDLLGTTAMDQWFAAADAVNNAKLYINDFGIITGNESNPAEANRQLYLSTIQGLLQRGTPIDGIGMQGHFSPDTLTGIEKVWEVLDRFAATGLPISITEYDLNTTDEQLKADYLRDFLTAVFAHEGTEAFLMWGFWEGRHWSPDAAMYNLDWSETPMARVWRELLYEAWWTDTIARTNALGEAQVRAFQGDYLIEFELDGRRYEYRTTIGPGQQTLDLQLQAVIPEPAIFLPTASALFLLRKRPVH